MEKSEKKEIDMLNGPLAGKIIFFALPLAFSSILQQLFNSADVAVVGHFCGDNSLAAVGANVAIVGVFVNLIVGLSVGPNAALANLIGGKRKEEIKEMIHTVIAFGFLLGIGLAITGIIIVKAILEASGTPEEIMDLALLYIRIYFLGMPFIVLYNFAAGVLRSFGDTKRPMYVLILTGLVNVVLNLFFVIICGLDVAGVAIATDIANFISAALLLLFLCREQEEFRLDLRKLCIKKKSLKKVLQIGIPTGISGSVFSISNIFVQSGINSFGADAIGGSSLALNFELFVYYVCSAFSQAAITFMSQNFGAGNIKRCNKILLTCMGLGFLFSETLAIIFIIGEKHFVYLYTTSSAVAAYAYIRMNYVCALDGLCTTYDVSGSGMRALGKSIEPAVVTILGTVVFRIIWMFTVFRYFKTFESLMSVYVASWLLTGGIITFLYARLYKKLLAEHETNINTCKIFNY